MLFRRISENLKNQNWTAVGFDFAIVVIGVFLGIQFSNWNDIRANRSDEEQILKRLHQEVVDLETERAVKRQASQQLRDQMNEARRILFSIADTDDFSSSHCRAIASASFQPGIIDSLPAVDDLYNTGRLTILADEDLRVIIARFLQERDDLRRDLDRVNSYAVRLGAKYPDLFKARLEKALPGEIDRWSVDCDLESMRANNALLLDVAASVDSYSQYVRAGFGRLDPIIAQLREKLDLRHGTSPTQN